MQKELNNTIKALKKGGIILYPTDTIWGIGCDALNTHAVDKIFKLKKRIESKALISLVNSKNMIDRFTDSRQLRFSLSEKPTTIIYQNVTGLAKNLIASDNTAGLRITNDPFCNNLVRSFDSPIVSTSANISGQPNPKGFSEICEEIKNKVDYIVNLRREDVMDTPSEILYIELNGTIKKLR